MMLQLVLSILLVLQPQYVGGIPYMILSTPAAKCMKFNVGRKTVVTVNYHMPDVPSLSDADVEDETKPGTKVDEVTEALSGDALSQKYSERYKEQMEAMKKMGKIWTTVTIILRQIFEDDKNLPYAQRKANQQRRMAHQDRGTELFKTQVSEKHGNLNFTTAPMLDGPLEVCVQAQMASRTNPVRFRLDYTFAASQAEKAEDTNKQIEQQVTRMHSDLQSLERKVQMIMNNAVLSKDEDVRFHQRSLSMSRQTTIWPIVHIVVLVIAGYIQASHILKYFKKHHIV